MARHWKERLDPSRHHDHFVWSDGGKSIEAPHDKLIERWVYFVQVCGFIFEFQSVSQLGQCLRFFSDKTQRSSRRPGKEYDHWFHLWHERLPLWLFEGPKRQQVVKALGEAQKEFMTERG